jgi:hypothetical protein
VHIKFLRAGRSGQKAAAYLLKKRAAEEVIVRRGDPVFFANLVDSLDYAHPYSSAVIAFAPQDQPAEEQIEEVIEGFKRTAWAGLEDDDFCILVVEHRKKNGKGTHLHFLIARHHISRKIHYNPAPPGWQKRYDLLRDYLNSKYGWARPNDPERARKVQPGYLAFPGVAAEKRQVLAWAEALAEMGLNGEEIAEVARASGAKVPRMGTDYITLAWGKHRVRVRTKKKEKKEVAETIEEQKRKWERALEKLAEENQKRYGQKGEKHGRAGKRRGNSDTGTGRDRVRRVPARDRAGAGLGPGAGGVVVLPPAFRLGLERGSAAGIPEEVQCPGAVRRITREEIRSGIRIQWAGHESGRTTGGKGRGTGTPTGGVGVPDAAHHGGTRGAAPAAGSPEPGMEPGMAGLWAALERLLGRLGSALERANCSNSKALRNSCRFLHGSSPPCCRRNEGGGTS